MSPLLSSSRFCQPEQSSSVLRSHPNSLFPRRAARKQETKLFLPEEGFVSSLPCETALLKHTPLSHLPCPSYAAAQPSTHMIAALFSGNTAPSRHGSRVYPEAAVPASANSHRDGSCVCGCGPGPSWWPYGQTRDGADGLGGRRSVEQVPEQEECCLNQYYLLGNLTAVVSSLKRNPLLPG